MTDKTTRIPNARLDELAEDLREILIDLSGIDSRLMQIIAEIPGRHYRMDVPGAKPRTQPRKLKHRNPPKPTGPGGTKRKGS